MSTVICKCKHVSDTTLQKEIEGGADTLEKIQMRTGASKGACCGSRCKATINQMLGEKKHTGQSYHLKQ